MNIPTDLVYNETDEWIKAEGQTATLGVSDYAQDQLSDVVYVEILVEVGEVVSKGQQIATIESVKAAADVNTPVSGTIVAINEDLAQSPELVNKDPYGEAWMIKIEMMDPDELANLMDASAYETHCKERNS